MRACISLTLRIDFGAGMTWGTVELVLVVEPTAAREWMAAPAADGNGSGAAGHSAAQANAGARVVNKRAARGRVRAPVPARDDIATAIADALSRMPGISPVSAMAASTVRALIEPGGGWRITVAVSADGTRRVTAACAHEPTPGVWRCETVCDESIEAGAPLAFDNTLPQTIQDRLGTPEASAWSPALAARLGAWRWDGPDGAAVDIYLNDARVAFDSADKEPTRPGESAKDTKTGSGETVSSSAAGREPIAFCELRLVAPVGPLSAPAEDGAGGESTAESKTEASSSPPPADDGHSHSHSRSRSDRPQSSAVDADERNEAEGAALRAVFAAAAALTDVLPVFPALTDGYARVCARAAAAAPDAPVRAGRIDLSKAKTPHGALVDVAASVTRQWFGNEAGVRDSTGAETEFVHQMRVALRRLKTLLKTFPRWADDTWERAIVPDLDWLGELLGRARDLDVFVGATLPALAGADIDAAAWAPLQARAVACRDEARTKVRAALRTRRYAALLLTWLQWLAAQHRSPGPAAMAHKTLAGYARKRVRKHYARLIAKPALTALTPAERHRRRIEAKRLRYTLEFFESLASHKTRRAIAKQLGRIQSVLGDGSDATAALRFLEALEVPPYEHGFARGWCEAVNRWSAIEGERLLQELGKPKIMRAS
jgi:CHAD domain-containing protein